jgi:uncharacterized protein YwbE
MGCGGSSSTQVITSFIWGSTGSVSIKTIKLILSYDQKTKKISTKVSSKRITESLFSWRSRNFTLKDLKIVDLDNGLTYKCPNIQAKFSISEYDQFQDILNPDELIDQVASSQGKTLDSAQKKVLLNKIKKECKEFWEFSRIFWIKNKQIAKRADVTNFDRECLSYTVEKITDRNKIENFLYKKYKDLSFGKLKKDVKANVIMEKSDSRPHVVKLRKSNFIQIYLQSQELVEIEEEIRVMIFCWDDIPSLSDPSFLTSEMEKIESGTKRVYSDILKSIEDLQINTN